MKTAAMIARYLLGLGFVVFGLNGFLHFIPQPPMPPGPALNYLMALGGTGYMYPIFALQFLAGVLLLINRYVPLALTILAPILFNILLFHSLMQPSGLPPGSSSRCCGSWCSPGCGRHLRAFFRVA